MNLNPDGTATLTIAKTQVVLENPPFGILKSLEAQRTKLSEKLTNKTDKVLKALTETQQEIAREAASVVSRASAGDVEAEAQWDTYDEDDRQAVLDAYNEIATLPATALPDIAKWWVSAITQLSDYEFSSDQGNSPEDFIPANLVNFESMNDIIEHFKTSPFRSGR